MLIIIYLKAFIKALKSSIQTDINNNIPLCTNTSLR